MKTPAIQFKQFEKMSSKEKGKLQEQ